MPSDTDPQKLLFTPGPLTTSRRVKEAMLRDLGSRDAEFIDIVRDIRRRLLVLAGVDADTYVAIPMQGSGTFALESVVASTLPAAGKLLVLVNGAYGRRIARIASMLGIDHVQLETPENRVVDLDALRTTLADDEAVTHVAVVHCETTTGIMNPVAEVGEIVRGADRALFVDAMSSFGAIALDLAGIGIDYLVASANKCIEGVPGFGFVIARQETLARSEGCARSLSLDLLAQWRGLDASGQFRFTPPTHVLLAFHQALLDLEAEGGVEGRGRRYAQNHALLVEGMGELGFRAYLDPAVQGPIITSFHYPDDARFDFDRFYSLLNDRGMVIYPGKVSEARCFRIGTIGQIFATDIRKLLSSIEAVSAQMGLQLG